MKHKNGFLLIGSFCLGAVVTLLLSLIFPEKKSDSIISPSNYGEIASINQVYEALKSYHYFYEGDSQALIDGAISGMINALDDPHSTYFTMTDYENFVEHLEDTYSGIGCEVTTVNGYTMIVSPFPDSPADEAGILANDLVVEVDGENVVGQTLQEVTNKIKGPVNSTVTLGISRNDNPDLIYIEVTRKAIDQETVKSELITEEGQAIGYLQITTFGENTAQEFKTAIEELEGQGMTGLIVDLRNNSGGYLTSVVEMVDYILPPGKVITTIESRDGSSVSYETESEGKNYPVVTLINEGSASASEIFSAAMKEAGGYEVVGTTSYGKGTVQVSMPLDDHSSLKITTQVWKTPDNNWINEKGEDTSGPPSQIGRDSQRMRMDHRNYDRGGGRNVPRAFLPLPQGIGRWRNYRRKSGEDRGACLQAGGEDRSNRTEGTAGHEQPSVFVPSAGEIPKQNHLL